MANKAQTVIDVILGEAGGRTAAERYADMVAIASVISNRSTMGRVSPEDVVAVQSQFNAYGKALPAGVNAFRSLANLAWSQVQKAGPVHNATYYATPKAAKNLPNGLKEQTKTTNGHVYFSDPKGRSFRVATGYVQPARQSVATPINAPVPTSRPSLERPITPGLGLANLAPKMAGFRENYGPARPNTPDASIVNSIRESVTNVFGPGYSVVGTSGKGNYGSPSRHPTGLGLDFDVVDPMGNRVTNDARMGELAVDLAAKHGDKLGIGYGKGYMAPGRMHADIAGVGGAWGAKGRSANMDPSLAAAIADARTSGERITPFAAPTPTSREIGLAAPSARQAEAASMAALQASSRPAPQADPSARQAQEQSVARQAPQQGPIARQAQEMSMAATPQQAPQRAAMPSARQAEEQSMAALAALAQEQQALAPVQQQMAPALPPAREVAARQVAPIQSVASMPAQAPAQQQSVPTGMDAIAGLFSAPAGERANASWGGGSFQSRGGGLVDFTNEYGYTRTLSPNDYSFPTTARAPSQVAQERADRTAGRSGGFLGIPQTDNKFGNAARGMAGGMAGGLLGSAVGGPIGGLLGAALGRSIAQGQNPFGGRTGGLLGRGELSSALSGYTPGLGFPSAPNVPDVSYGSPSYSDMAAISPSAADAIAGGSVGLY